MNLIYRYRLLYVTAIILTMALGLFSRSHIVPMPEFVTLYVGDSLWALTVFWEVCLLRPVWNPGSQVILAISISYAIELSQLYQSPWLNEIRNTTPGGLILGFGFKVSDLIAYTIGIGVGAVLNYFLNQLLQARRIL